MVVQFQNDILEQNDHFFFSKQRQETFITIKIVPAVVLKQKNDRNLSCQCFELKRSSFGLQMRFWEGFMVVGVENKVL